MNILKLAKIADKFCEKHKKQFPNIWWCFGNSDECRILFYNCNWRESENTEPIWKMDSHGTISVICKNIPFGAYVCYEVIKELNICVDKCLVNEIKELNKMGIKTIGSCCGHKKGNGYIQVSSNFVKDMENLGYEQIQVESNGNGKWCFKPKTELN